MSFLTLIEDTRQQQWNGDKHSNIRKYCQRAGIEVERIALPFGDYCLSDRLTETEHTYTVTDPETGEQIEKTVIKKIPVSGTVVVDTKRNFLEIFSNLTHEHRRFRDECIRSQDAGCQLVILIEEVPPCGMVEMWRSPTFQSTTRYHKAGQPMTLANPVLIAKMMRTMREKYGVRFEFCEREQTGRVLIGILNGTYNLS